MPILSFNTNVTGLVGDTIDPRRCTMVTTDSLAVVTTPGYLNNQNKNGNPILPTDIFDVVYDYDPATKLGTFGIFQATYASATGFSLNAWENPGNVLLPVVSGNLPSFNGTSGQIQDSGIAPSALQTTASIKAASTASIGGAGAGPIVVPVAGLTAASVVVATVESSTNPVSVIACTAGAGNFSVTFSADPGASCLLNYIAFITPQ